LTQSVLWLEAVEIKNQNSWKKKSRRFTKVFREKKSPKRQNSDACTRKIACLPYIPS